MLAVMLCWYAQMHFVSQTSSLAKYRPVVVRIESFTFRTSRLSVKLQKRLCICSLLGGYGAAMLTHCAPYAQMC